MAGGVALLALASPYSAKASDWTGSARITAGAGFDSNARRDYQQLGPEADAVASILGAGQLRYAGERVQAQGIYELGGRKFATLSSEDVLVQAASAEVSRHLGGAWDLGCEGFAKDRRGGDRDYTDLAGSGFIRFTPDAAVDVRLRGSAHRFLYRPVFPYSFKATEVGLDTRFRVNRRHSLFSFAEGSFRQYNSGARPGPRIDPSADLEQRQDFMLLAGAGYSYRGPFAFSVTYSYAEAASNSFGESLQRHRFTASAALHLPLELVLLLQGSLQFTRYPDGPYPTPDIILIEDENHDSLSAKLVRPLSGRLDLEIHAALYHDDLPQNGLTYWRHVAWMGLTWRL